MPTGLETVDLDGVDLMTADVRVHGSGCPPEGVVFDEAKLAQVAADTNEVIDERRPFVKISHSPEQRLAKASGLYAEDGETPATGWLRNFAARDGKLVSDVKTMPKKLAGLVESGAFRLRSAEIGPYTSQVSGKTYPAVIRALAFLGAQAPAFKTLDDIYAVYAGEEREPLTVLLAEDEAEPVEIATADYETRLFADGAIVWEPEEGFQDLQNDLAALLNPGPGETKFYVQDVSRDATRAIVNDWSDNKTWIVPVTVGADGEPSIGPSSDWVEAEQAWVAAGSETAAPATEYADDEETPAPADTRRQMAKITYTEENLKALADAVGVEFAEGDEKLLDTIVAAATELKAKADAPVEPEKVEPTIPDGMKLMSEDNVAELRAFAEQGVEANKALKAMKRDKILDDALRVGKFDPAKRDEFVAMFDENPDWTTKIIEALEPQEKFQTFGADGEGGAHGEPATGDMDEEQYKAFCESTGIPYVAREQVAA